MRAWLGCQTGASENVSNWVVSPLRKTRPYLSAKALALSATFDRLPLARMLASGSQVLSGIISWESATLICDSGTANAWVIVSDAVMAKAAAAHAVTAN